MLQYLTIKKQTQEGGLRINTVFVCWQILRISEVK